MKNDDSHEEEEPVTEIKLPLSAYIPDSYIGDETSKLLTYKRLSKIKTAEELADMKEELKDRYGPVPGPLANLLDIIGLKIMLTGMKMKRLEYSGKQIILQVTERTPAGHEEGHEDGKGGQGKGEAAARRKDRDPKRPKAGRYRERRKKYVAGACYGMI